MTSPLPGLRVQLEDYITWAQHGFAGPDGQIGAGVAVAGWIRPAVLSLEAEHLCWQFRSGEHGDMSTRFVQAGPEMLEGFLSLDGADDAAVFAFAQRWGVLEVCEHGYTAHSSAGHHTCHNWEEPDFDEKVMHEPLSAWRALIARGVAILHLAANLASGDLGADEHWSAALGHPLVADKTQPYALAYERVNLASLLDDWMWIGGVRPGFAYEHDSGDLRVQLSPGGLLGALGVQLGFAAARSEALAMCSSCGRPYLPKRRPAAGRRSYCPDCGLKAARRDASRAHRSRKRRSS